MHILDTDVPLLLSVADMYKLKVYYTNLKNNLCNAPSGADATIVRLFEHLSLQWDPIQQCYFTVNQFLRLHKRFDNHSADKLYTLLRWSGLRNVSYGS